MLSKSAQHASFRVRITVGVRRSVAPFQPKLVRAQPVELNKEFLVEFHPTLWVGIDLYHPTLYPIGIELFVPRRVQRVGEVDALAVAADLDHLRTAIQSLLGLLRVCRPAHDATEVDRTSLLRVRRIRDVVLDELTCPPARNIQEAVVE